ncbi:hypothetical protein [Hoeflea ulvae]|uniref:Uncharacterized protein n=1 Tax=Hoeflea ulvae TaxID=2983764 RepID=A0ABT3YCZ9_9HYPH|nr:hypothetical protein [Hoeflea ulvae]MCY0093772.1 hypothetical protein [Hoeflea ulvae]
MSEFPTQPAVGAISDPVSTEQPAGKLQIYRLEPNTRPDDPRWDNAPNHGAVRVRAFSPADARIVAAEAEVDFLDIDAKPGDGTTTDFASAFRDDKLYHVTLEEEGDVPGERGLIRDA